MAQSKQTPRVWSDAIRGSEILANWTKLGISAVLLWLSIGILVGGIAGASWFMNGTTSLDRRLWMHHVPNGMGLGGQIANLPDPSGSGSRMFIPKDRVQHFTRRGYEPVSKRIEEGWLLGIIVAVGTAVTAAVLLRQSGRTATEDQHVRGATFARADLVIGLTKPSLAPYDFTLAAVPFSVRTRLTTSLCVVRREAERA